MDIKRSSDGVVDAISAEDIGKFPDTNLAESLQRTTGVSIYRASGEGSKVSVRGFGPANHLITLNGHQLPTTTGDRIFYFANIASDRVSGVNVYKHLMQVLPLVVSVQRLIYKLISPCNHQVLLQHSVLN